MDTLHYGLSSELREYDRRFADALSNDRKEQALTDLNDATSGADGRRVRGHDDRVRVLPRARRARADDPRAPRHARQGAGGAAGGRRAAADRARAQPADPESRDRSGGGADELPTHRRIAATASSRAKSSSTCAPTPARSSIAFREVLASGTPARNRNDCEGFDKYLDSLGVISQRGVLIKHDTDIKAKVAGGARALPWPTRTSCPSWCCDVILEAFAKAERLLGLSDQIDELVERWQKLDEAARADAAKAAAAGTRAVRPRASPAAGGSPGPRRLLRFRRISDPHGHLRTRFRHQQQRGRAADGRGAADRPRRRAAPVPLGALLPRGRQRPLRRRDGDRRVPASASEGRFIQSVKGWLPSRTFTATQIRGKPLQARRAGGDACCARIREQAERAAGRRSTT